MAHKIKIVSVIKRKVVVDMEWDDGLTKNGIEINDVPVESFEAARIYLTEYVKGLYKQARDEADAVLRANPVPDPLVMAAVGHVFDDAGQMVS